MSRVLFMISGLFTLNTFFLNPLVFDENAHLFFTFSIVMSVNFCNEYD